MPKNRRLVLLAVMALATFALSQLMLRNGISASSDSWAYWAGSVNLIEHHTYTSMLGDHITGWPPFFSLYLALFESVLGQTGWVLTLALSVLAAGNGIVWGAYVFKVLPEEEQRARPAFIGSMVFVVIFLSLTTRSLLANEMQLLFLGLLFNLFASLTDDGKSWVGLKKPALAGLLLACAILTHNSTIIYVFAVALLLLVEVKGTWLQRARGAGVVVLISVVPWIVMLHWLGQEGRHSISRSRYSTLEYVHQLLYEFGVYFIPSSSVLVQALLGAVLWAAIAALIIRRPRSSLESRHRLYLGFAAVVLGGLFLLFNFVWIDSRLGDRFTWYFVLVAAPIAFYHARKHAVILTVLLLMTVGVSGWRLGKAVWHGRVQPLVAGTQKASDLFIHSEYFLSSKADVQTPANAVRIGLPIYPWEAIPPGMVVPPDEPFVWVGDGETFHLPLTWVKKRGEARPDRQTTPRATAIHPPRPRPA